jgi:hypothetical protein
MSKLRPASARRTPRAKDQSRQRLPRWKGSTRSSRIGTAASPSRGGVQRRAITVTSAPPAASAPSARCTKRSAPP